MASGKTILESGIRRSSLNIKQSAWMIPVFILLCTMNAGGYRYGASDQALYTPAVLRHLDPNLFPRDAPLIDTQAGLMLNDEAVAAITRLTGASLPNLYFVLYLATLALLLYAAVRLGSCFYRTRGGVLAFAAALTLRHAIAKTGTNTLEGYFHPRQVAFALGLLAVACFLERRDRIAIALVAAAGVAHTTTVMWFAAWLGVALWIDRPAWRRSMAAAIAAGTGIAIWALFRGPLAGRLVQMDAAWLAVIADKDYLFPLAWPVDAWMTNLVSVPVIAFAWRARQRAGLLVDRETPLIVGALTLLVIFFCWLPFNAAHVALAVQLQTSRLFWMLDVLATVYLVWAVAEGTSTGAAVLRKSAAISVVIVLLSAARGMYISFVEFPDRRIVAVDVQNADWRNAMAWARTTSPGSGWLADPAHATLYGSSVRAIGQRDVLLETTKDSALAMYARSIAMRVDDRRRALETTRWDTPEGARALAQRYNLDYLVTHRTVDLPIAYRAGSITIYSLR
jgi:hypothetical protein